MPSNTYTVTESINYNSQTFGVVRTVTGENFVGSQPPSGIPAANAGTLTTRTDNDTGTVTLSGGHTVVNGRVDAYWADGSRIGMTATVTVNSVVIDGGAGDNLPAQDAAIRLTNPTEGNIDFTAAAAVGAIVYSQLGGSDYPATVVFAESDDSTVATYELTATVPNQEWSQAATPFGADVAKVFFSQGNTDAVRVVGAVILYD